MRILLIGVAVLACTEAKSPERPAGGGQTFADAVAMVCEVDELATLSPAASPIMIEGERYDWLISNVKHPDMIEMVTLMRVRSESERAEMLRDVSTEVCRDGCSLADYFEGDRPDQVLDTRDDISNNDAGASFDDGEEDRDAG